MMKSLKFLIIICLVVFSMVSCKQDKIGPQGTSHGTPSMVTNPIIENLPGAAKITFTLPVDPDLLYVKAVYLLGDNVQEIKSSYYTNYLVLKGFGDTNEYEVKLYAVNRNEELSQPLIVTIHPLEPPVKTIFNSISARAVFGGMSLDFTNANEAEVKINVLAVDSLGDWVDVDALYTKRISGSFAVRGFMPKNIKFGIFVQDRWNNLSDTLITELTPLFEIKLDKLKFKEYRLVNDATVYPGWVVSKLWDNKYSEGEGVGYHSVGTGVPQQVSFDMGVKARLSRFKYWQRDTFFYGANNPRIFEIWGSNNPDPDGGWTQWTKLMDCESMKPSGTGPVTNEDIAYGSAGEDFIFPEGIPSVRYIRFKTLKTWSSSGDVHFMELTFWGQLE